MTIMYSCIQESLGGLSKCLPTRLLITAGKKPAFWHRFLLWSTQEKTHAHIHTVAHKSYVPLHLSNEWRGEGALQSVFYRDEQTTVRPWRRTLKQAQSRHQAKTIDFFTGCLSVLQCLGGEELPCLRARHVFIQLRCVQVELDLKCQDGVIKY